MIAITAAAKPPNVIVSQRAPKKSELRARSPMTAARYAVYTNASTFALPRPACASAIGRATVAVPLMPCCPGSARTLNTPGPPPAARGDPRPVHGREEGPRTGPVLPQGLRRADRRARSRLRRPRRDRVLRGRRGPADGHRDPPVACGRGEGPPRPEGEGRAQALRGPSPRGRRGPGIRRLGAAVRAHAIPHIAAPHVRDRLAHLRRADRREPTACGPRARRLPARELHSRGPHADRGGVQRGRGRRPGRPDLRGGPRGRRPQDRGPVPPRPDPHLDQPAPRDPGGLRRLLPVRRHPPAEHAGDRRNQDPRETLQGQGDGPDRLRARVEVTITLPRNPTQESKYPDRANRPRPR